jgi:NADH:ubiquinone reductase (H+-translocating)
VAITLVNAADVFVERLRLHQVAANQAVARRPIADILRGMFVY